MRGAEGAQSSISLRLLPAMLNIVYMLFLGTSLYQDCIYFNYRIFISTSLPTVSNYQLSLLHSFLAIKFQHQISLIWTLTKYQKQQRCLQFYQPMSERSDLITNVDPSSSVNLVYEAHKRLNRQIDDMSNKIDVVMDKNQAEFLLAYQNHIRKIKIELAEIKSKTDAHEKQMSKNDRMNYLQKQVTLFREEALKLYDRLEQKTHEAEIYKIKSKELEKTCLIAQKEVKQHMKVRKLLEAKLVEAENKIAEIQEDLKTKNQTIGRKPTYSEQSNSKSVFLNNLNIRLRDQQAKDLSANKTVSLGIRRKSMNSTTGGTFNTRQQGQLKDWFLECVKAIKKDVAQRKNTVEQVSFDYIKNIDEFKMVDKLRLLQKFMENEKLLVWMYEKIFPSRIDEVKEYLAANTSSTKKTNIQSEQVISSLQIFEEIPPEKVELLLPKMSEHKPKKSQIRNKISIKDGKLNLTLS